MKLIIDISEELFAKVPTLLNKGNIWIGDVLDAVKNGTPLEAQPTSDDDIIKALKAVRTIHNGNYAPQIDEAIRRLKAQPSEDCVSKEAVTNIISTHLYEPFDDGVRKASCYGVLKRIEKQVDNLPSVTPTNEDIKEAYLKGYDYGVKDWFKSKTQPTEAVSREAVEEITFQEPSYTDPYNILTEVREKVRALPSVTPERPKGKWNFIGDQMFECSSCKRVYTQNQFEELRIYTTDDLLPKYCPYCGSYNGGGEDGNSN